MKIFSFFENLFQLQATGLHSEEPAALASGTSTDGVLAFLNTPLIENDFWQLVFKFSFNLLTLFFIVRLIYYPTTRRKDYLFTYMLISLITFFICFILHKNNLGLGMALGLFAVFGIIRYRTDTIPIKEMTYLFIVIGISVINALAGPSVSYAELIFTNLMVVIFVYGLEKIWLLRHESSKLVLYEKIELIKPQHKALLIKDLEQRTGLKINRVTIGKIDFLKDTALLQIYYYESGSAPLSDYTKKDDPANDDPDD